ncbi:oxalate oxidoreductase subunit alpha [Caldinitratiruptor microaerophilus]|uniref:Oxalate oxidoreductase subunit alpha n=1 Tax=Caldinitratiruptor microaerophilus TaxID=671077 RepID=A0AA35G916_9FIRM|nr:pyruvate ferredoxin oxidoreductase [Caldinitratiruptor microaerophilus]BDG60993.1 oxalate oxidoreductase subunit alpha [Caldinitratiruptor microaerophilus]
MAVATKRRLITGCVAVAHGVRLADVDVISSYPIRPYTGIMSELARMIADGELDAEFLHGAGEHDQLSIVYGAAASGARTFTGSSGVGVTYAAEVYSPISGERLPVQMAIADRTLDPPGDFGSEHTDAMTFRNQGWIMGWAATPQEALDNTIFLYRVGEDPRVSLPQFSCQDGYFVSHVADEVEIYPDEQVREWLPPYRPRHVLDPRHPMSLGPQIEPEMGPPLQYQRQQAMEEARRVIYEVTEDFNRAFGRNYAPFLDEYLTDDAEVVFVLQGAHALTARTVAQKLRNLGDKVGVIRLRWIRPFPTQELRESLSRFKAVGVVDNSVDFGVAAGAGPLAAEVRAACYGLGDRTKIVGFVAGLGGEVISREEFYHMAHVLQTVARTGKVERDGYWLPFDLPM